MHMEFKPVVFKVNNQEYGVDIGLVRGVEKLQNIVNVPNSNPDIRGIINLRGDVVPVYSFRHHFHLEEAEPTDDTKFIVVNIDGMSVALEVDAVEEIHDIEDFMIQDIPKIIKSEDTRFIDKVVNFSGRLVLIIDIKNLLTEEESEDLQKMIEKISE